MPMFSIDVKIYATAYIRANTAADARRIAEEMKDYTLELDEQDGAVPISGLDYDDPELPPVSLSPAMTIHGPDDDAQPERADADDDDDADGHAGAPPAPVAAATPQPTTVPPDARGWLIWSQEHRGWWKPGELGYTPDITHAGRYPLDQAVRICRAANIHLSAAGAIPEESLVPVPGFLVTAPPPASACEAAARARGWEHGGDNGGFIYDGTTYGSWKEAVSGDGPTYATWEECCDEEDLAHE